MGVKLELLLGLLFLVTKCVPDDSVIEPPDKNLIDTLPKTDAQITKDTQNANKKEEEERKTRINNGRSIDAEKFDPGDYQTNDNGYVEKPTSSSSSTIEKPTKKLQLSTPRSFFDAAFEEAKQKIEQDFEPEDSEEDDMLFVDPKSKPNSTLAYRGKTKISKNNTVSDGSEYNELKVETTHNINYDSVINFTNSDEDEDEPQTPDKSDNRVANNHLLSNKIESDTIKAINLLVTTETSTKRLNPTVEEKRKNAQINNPVSENINNTKNVENTTTEIDNTTKEIDNTTTEIEKTTLEIEITTKNIENTTIETETTTEIVDNTTVETDNTTENVNESVNTTLETETTTKNVDYTTEESESTTKNNENTTLENEITTTTTTINIDNTTVETESTTKSLDVTTIIDNTTTQLNDIVDNTTNLIMYTTKSIENETPTVENIKSIDNTTTTINNIENTTINIDNTTDTTTVSINTTDDLNKNIIKNTIIDTTIDYTTETIPHIENTTKVTQNLMEYTTKSVKIMDKSTRTINNSTTTKEIIDNTTEVSIRNASAPTTTTTEDSSETSSAESDGGELSGSDKGKIAAIIISSVGAVCLMLLAGLLYVMRKRQRRFNYKQRCRPVGLDDYSVDNVSGYNSTRRKAERQSKRSYGNPAFDDPVAVTHPLNFPALAKFATNKEDIKAEFEEIPQITTRTNELPEGCETKNRYANVIPLPETRVFLQPIEEYANSDYINANYVTGPKNTKGYYIACQAPMSETVDDFWRMVWEQQTKVILMLTHLFENGMEKCVDYLPPSEVLDCNRLFGDFQVTLKKRDVKDKYIISNLQLKNMVSNSWREITHFWYLGWPEKGVPTEENSIIAFLIEARSYMKTATLDKNASLNGSSNKTEINPVVVHCSPGTGRTGVVIACDIAIREFEQTRLVDIPKIVYRIRRDRAGAVQTKEQYMFIYKVVSLYATKLTGGALESL